MKIDLTNEEINFLYKALDCNYAEIENCNGHFNDSVPEIIKQKLIATFKIDFNFLKNSRQYKYYKNNYFSNNKLFLGSGIHSVNDVSIAHKRLAYAISNLSAIQQNGGMGTEFNDIMDKECTNNIKEALKDIIKAFGITPEELNDK